MKNKVLAILLAGTVSVSLAACGGSGTSTSSSASTGTSAESTSSSSSSSASSDLEVTSDEERADIEAALDLAQNENTEWTYDSDHDAWVLSVVSAVTNPEVPDEQGVSVAVPGAYVRGIDTDGDGKADVTSDSVSSAVTGNLVINKKGTITSENGQIYTAATAPVLVNCGGTGYSQTQNSTATTEYARDGYVSMTMGNRGKTSTVTDSDGNTTYTGESPKSLVDQKNAIRFVKYNILLGNLPGSVDYFVTTGGSGAGAHASMVAATGNSSDYYDYEIEAGAVGVYRNDDGTYSTTVTVDDKEQEISDGVWGCVAYSAITSLAESDLSLAFEYSLDDDYDFNTSFQKQLASYLSEEYMDYINGQKIRVKESKVGFDLNDDGDQKDTVTLKIEYDEDRYADTNGWGGTYLTLYLKEFQSNLQSYLDNLDYASGWTWFDEDGHALSDEEVAAMTSEDRAKAFLEGRYAKGTDSSSSGGPGGAMGGAAPDGAAMGGGAPTGEMPDGAPGQMGGTGAAATTQVDRNGNAVGTPTQGSDAAAGSSTDSSLYASFEDMLEAYESDISEIEAGDAYGNNIVTLMDPLSYIGSEDVDAPTWTRIVMGASEGDESMFESLNMELAWLNSGTDAVIEWQWDGGHVPSEILGDSLSLYIDEMYGQYVDGAVKVEKPEAEVQTTNGTATEATGTDISSWVTYRDGKVSFSLADAAAYRVAGASKAMPGFDTMDLSQETYVFGDADSDARHFDKYVLQAMQEHQDVLEKLFNAGSTESSTAESAAAESAAAESSAQ